jgi:hypothetical protein
MTTLFPAAIPTVNELSDSTSSTSSRPRAMGATVRQAKLQDAVQIFDIVSSLAHDGTLLRRPYAEICENVRDFAIAESEGADGKAGTFLGCGALQLGCCAGCCARPTSRASPRCVCSRASPTSSSISAFASPTVLRCRTKSTKIARPAPAYMLATRSPWCVDRFPGSPCLARAPFLRRNWSNCTQALSLLQSRRAATTHAESLRARQSSLEWQRVRPGDLPSAIPPVSRQQRSAHPASEGRAAWPE